MPLEAEKRMGPTCSVFNCHVNNAGRRADEEFVALFGQKRFDRHIRPYHVEGIMSLFQCKPNKWQLVWVALVSAFVNEDRRPHYGSSPDDTCAFGE